MLRVSEDDVPSFETLLARNRRAVLNHLYRLVRNRAIAEELAQDVFLRVYRARKSYRPGAKFATWLFRITTNVALNWRRDTRRESAQVRLDDNAPGSVRKLEVADQAPGADQRLAQDQWAEEIRAAIESLPAKQLAAVLLHKYEGMDYAQIAQVLDCSIPALKSLLFRAYETLRRRLAHLAPHEAN
ncbi:MAG: sigma-70 family RNA polymerase sigma factor [Acidobacteriia bacterium]|nr:sigma-70 family RNA polymerase sigma factor [Terriglobia bacterium]